MFEYSLVLCVFSLISQNTFNLHELPRLSFVLVLGFASFYPVVYVFYLAADTIQSIVHVFVKTYFKAERSVRCQKC
jgi:hypothetical protein